MCVCVLRARPPLSHREGVGVILHLCKGALRAADVCRVWAVCLVANKHEWPKHHVCSCACLPLSTVSPLVVGL